MEELIKKLNSVKLPDIEIENHKKKLGLDLINSGYFKKSFFGNIFSKTIFLAAPATALLLILAITIVQPKLTEAKAMEIAKNNKEVKRILEEQNMEFGEIKIKDNKAYILINSTYDSDISHGNYSDIRIKKTKNVNENIESAIIEINIEKKEIVKIDPIKSNNIPPLNEEEKKSAQNIILSEEIVSNIIPKEAKIEKVIPIPQNVHIIEKDDGVEIVSDSGEEKKASIQYNLNGKKWSVKVNLHRERIEEIEYQSDYIDDDIDKENKNNKGRKEKEIDDK